MQRNYGYGIGLLLFVLVAGLYLGYRASLGNARPGSPRQPPRAAATARALILPAFPVPPPTGYLPGDSLGFTPALAYWRLGDKPITVIVLHGGPGATHAYLRPEWDALQAVATVIYYDQRGVGRSGLATCYSWQQHVQDLHRLRQTLAADTPVILAGSSWGSTLALLYAYTYPGHVQGLILAGTYAWGGRGQPLPLCYPSRSPASVAAQRHAARAARYSARLEEARLVAPGSAQRRPVAKLIRLTRGQAYSETLASMPSAPPYPSLSRLTLPILLLRGDQAPAPGKADGGEQYARVLPGLQLSTIAGAGHDAWLANPARFFQQCQRFIDKVTPKGPNGRG